VSRPSAINIAAEPLLQYSPCSLDFMPWLPQTARRHESPRLARYQIILLGEQRHIGVNNLPLTSIEMRHYHGS